MRGHVWLIGAAVAIAAAVVVVVTRQSERALPNPPVFTVKAESSLSTQACSKRHGLTDVSCSKEVDVIQHVVKLVHRDARVALRMVGDVGRIGFNAIIRKTAEEFHHGDVRPPVADAAGRIDHGDALSRVVPIARG